jgi:hypothetical protein
MGEGTEAGVGASVAAGAGASVAIAVLSVSERAAELLPSGSTRMAVISTNLTMKMSIAAMEMPATAMATVEQLVAVEKAALVRAVAGEVVLSVVAAVLIHPATLVHSGASFALPSTTSVGARQSCKSLAMSTNDGPPPVLASDPDSTSTKIVQAAGDVLAVGRPGAVMGLEFNDFVSPTTVAHCQDPISVVLARVVILAWVLLVRVIRPS